MQLAISRSLLDAVLADVALEPGCERCGLLFGDVGRVLGIEPTANVANDPETSFEIAPDRLIAAARGAREGGLPVIGHYHSHPGGVAQPSARDAAAAAGDGGRIWLIVAGGNATAWVFTGAGQVNGFEPVVLAITGDGT